MTGDSCTTTATVLICFYCATFENEISVVVLTQSRCWFNPWEKSYNRCRWCIWHQSGTEAAKSGISTMGLYRNCIQYIKLGRWRQDKSKLCIPLKADQGASTMGGLEFQSSWQYSLRCEIELQNWAVITLWLLSTLSPPPCSRFLFLPIIPRSHSRPFPLDGGAQPNCSEYSILACPQGFSSPRHSLIYWSRL